MSANCFFHPEEEGVVVCGKCGVSMCRTCEANAFMRLDGGTGQALCNRCSLTEAQNVVSLESTWLKKRLVKLIICGILILLGIISVAIYGFEEGSFTTVILWFCSGVVANIGVKKDNGSVKNQVWGAMFDYNHPIMSMIISLVVNTVLAPIMLIANFIGYFRTKADYQKNLELLNTIKAAS